MAANSMMGDGSWSRSAHRAVRLLAFAYLVVFAVFIALAAGVAFLGDPQAGNPIVRLEIKPKRLAPTAQRPARSLSTATAPDATLVPPPGGTTLPGNVAPGPQQQPVIAGSALVAIPDLIETTPQGPLPRIAENGTTPMRAYAPPFVAGSQPKIAIVISGLGISAKATTLALSNLPPGVTLAFAPYAGDVQHWVAEARTRGHEVLLEVPMEPYDFPDSDPGQYTLRSGVAEDSNTQRLVWALTRFTGYTGATNLLGGRLLSDATALEPVLTYLSRRGLMFFDNGSAIHSVAPDVAARVGAPFVQSTETIDTIQAAMEIDRHLSDLETAARAKGSASGSGFLYPVTIDRVAKWAQGLQGRGFVLVPVSAIVTPAKQ